MTAKEISAQHDSLIQNCRDFIYSACTTLGKLVDPGDNEQKYFRVPCDVPFVKRYFPGVLFREDWPKIIAIRAYVTEGWIYVERKDYANPIDLDDLHTDDLVNIVNALNESLS